VEDADSAGAGLTASVAIARAAGGHALLQAVLAEIGTPSKPPNSRSLGMKLSNFRERMAGGKYFASLPGANHTGTNSSPMPAPANSARSR
jgi:hypothetical protein